MLKSKMDFKCRLVDSGTEEELLRFTASTVTDEITNASFVGGGIASAGQAFTIWTERAFDYQAYKQIVIVGDTRYKLVSVQKGMRKRLGAHCTNIVPIYVLSLE